MWNFKSLHIKNIMSHEDTYYEFIQNKTVPIFGSKKKSNGQFKSNGAGKTTLFEGLNIAFRGSSIRNVNNNDIVRNGCEFGEVVFIMENKLLNKVVKIHRVIYSGKKSSECTIWVNEIEQTKLVDINNKKDFIFNDLLAISQTDFENYFLINNDNYTSFITASNTNKIAAINRFSKADKIDSVFALIDEDVKKNQIKIDNLEKDKISINAKIDVYQEELLKYVEFDLNKEKKSVIEDLRGKIGNNDTLIEKHNEDIKEFKQIINITENLLIKKIPNDINKLEKLLKEEESKEQKLSEEIAIIKNSIKNVENEFFVNDKKKIDSDELKYKNILVENNKELIELNAVLVELDKQLQESIECPKCSHTFSLNVDNLDIESIKSDIKEGSELKLEYEENISKANKETLKISDRKKEYRKNIDKKIEETKEQLSLKDTEQDKISDKIDQLKEEIKKLNKDVKTNKDDITEYQEKIKKINDKIVELKENNRYIEDEISEINKNNITDPRIDLNTNIEILVKKLEEVENILEIEINNKQKTEEWIFIFKKFKSYLANKSLSIINGYVNMYLEKMKTDTQIEIEGFKLLKNGKIKEDIDIRVIREGGFGESESIAKFSGGERGNIDLAFILTMQRLINNSSSSGGINFVGVDEVCESIDSVGIEEIIKALNNLNETVYFISHVPFVSDKFENAIIVNNVKEISSIN